jgi:hypothetical protein
MCPTAKILSAAASSNTYTAIHAAADPLGHHRIRFNCGLRIDAAVNGLRLTGIEFDARTLRVIADAIGAGEGCGDAVAADVSQRSGCL